MKPMIYVFGPAAGPATITLTKPPELGEDEKLVELGEHLGPGLDRLAALRAVQAVTKLAGPHQLPAPLTASFRVAAAAVRSAINQVGEWDVPEIDWAETIKQLRLGVFDGLPIRSFARVAGVHEATASRWESGNNPGPSATNIHRLRAFALAMSLPWKDDFYVLR